jgi:phosphate transport system substrate-binding protein
VKRIFVCAMFFATLCRAADMLEGAGATFPAPLYQKWIAAFLTRSPGFGINYRGVGSGEGVELLKRGEADFAGTDAPLSDDELRAIPRKVVHIPTVVGGVVPIYHIDGLVHDLRFTPQVLAGIYLGKIKRWDDPQIKAANRGVALTARAIAVVHRSDRSGTTFVWSDYLSKTSPEWRSAVGTGASIMWPVGRGADGNEGVTEAVRSTPDSIGYVEFIYAVQAHLSYGSVRNASGRYVPADLNSLPAAALSANFTAPDDLRVSITNAAPPRAYPIAAFTYLLVPRQSANPEKARAMGLFLRWALTSGQKQSAALGYAALPDEIAKRALEAAAGIQ